MEPANIDWKNIQSVYIEDELYEHINAPKWVDFTAPQIPVDDEAWFCKPDCRHPKTAEDFLQSLPYSKVKHMRSLSSISEPLLLGDRNQRDGYLKRRVHNESQEDRENQNPNFSTPPHKHQINHMKEAIKSSTEKKMNPLGNSPGEVSSQERRKPQLKSTLSARNLFSGKDIMSQITEFCNELKKLTTRAKEREDLEKSSGKKVPMNGKRNPFQEISVKTNSVDLIENENEKEKEKKPLLGEKGKSETPNSNGKEKPKRKNCRRNEESENIEISVDIKKVVADNLLQVRTNPPSPQCFSATRPLRPAKAKTPLKTIKSMPTTERGILQEMEHDNIVLTSEPASNEKVFKKNTSPATTNNNNTGTEEARSLDIFWFLKPCTTMSS